MRNVLAILLLAWACVSEGQAQVNHLEYFLTKDPGVGNATSVSITPGSDISASFDVGLSSLAPGFHTLGLRTRTADGQWSHTTRNTFLIMPDPIVGPTPLAGGEYFIDKDPGFGKGLPIAVPSGATDARLVIDVDLSEVPLGHHTLYTRVRDSEGRWSQTTANFFYVGPDQAVEDVVAFHYHFTSTDFESDASVHEVTVPAADVHADFTADLETLPGVGEYVLHIYAVTASGQQSVVSAQPFTIELEAQPTEQTLTFPSIADKVYGDAAFKLHAEASSGLPVTYTSSDSQVATVTADGTVSIIRPGSVTITARQSGNDEYLAAKEVARSFTIAKATLKVMAKDESRLFGEGNPTFTLVYSGFVKDDNQSVLTRQPEAATVANAQSPVGTYPITVGGGTSAHYTFVYEAGTLTVKPKERILTFNALPPVTYGAGPVVPVASVNTGDAITFSSDNAKVATVSAAGELVIQGAGTAEITASVPENTAYTGVRQITRTLVVQKATQKLSGGSFPKLQYGDPAFDPGVLASSKLPVTYKSADERILKVAANGQIQVVGAGAVRITAMQAGNANVEAAPDVTTMVVVGKAPLTITAPKHTREYGAENPSFDPAFAGFVNGDTRTVLNAQPVLKTTANRSTDVGDYAITVAGAASDRYEISYVAGVLTITPATRKWTFNELAPAVFGGATIALNASLNTEEVITYTSSNTGVARIADGHIVINGVGTATITASVAANKNYGGATSISRQLVVDKAPQQITFDPVPTLQRRGNPFTLTVVASSGLPVELSLADSFTATLDGNTLTPLRVGRSMVVATQAGDDNYLPAESVAIAIAVTDENNALVRVHPAISPDGDGINDFLVIEGISDFPDNHLTLFSPAGLRVYEVKNYDNGLRVFDGTGNVGRVGKLPQGTYFYVLEFDTHENGRMRQTGYVVLRY